MTEVRLRGTLKELRDKYVYVSSEGSLYVLHGEEYIQKRYFSPKEVAEIIEMSVDAVYDLCKLYGAKQKGKRKALFITIDQLKQMIHERVNS